MGFHLRALRESDVPHLSIALSECGAFSDEEVAVAEAMLRDAVNGEYQSVVAVGERVCGYALFGKTPFTESTWHLYWICVAPPYHRSGAGSLLLEAMQERVMRDGGRRIMVETSGRAAYEPARQMYTKAGYVVRARILNYYRQADDLLLLEKSL